ncbi:hypothetical protein AB664_26435 [Brucella anthropi]|uniref:Uncharacterized protein n=1 Tax=Brucella anthropi TaxID=529 RepID=A0A656Z8U5_BRUAN|nr:hypothetical protein AB664_26435 [Brucella anthropi]
MLLYIIDFESETGSWPPNFPRLPDDLASAVCARGEALARLDERLAQSPAGKGVIGRAGYANTCASLWIDRELVEMEYLVLHEAERDIHSASHALTISRDVL